MAPGGLQAPALRPPPSAGRHRTSITGPEDKSRLDGRTLDEAVGRVLGVGAAEPVPGLGVETRTKAGAGTRPCGRGKAGETQPWSCAVVWLQAMAMLLARVTGQDSGLSRWGHWQRDPRALQTRCPRRAGAEELDVLGARGPTSFVTV